MIAPCVPRPASSPPPARWRAFVLPSFRPPCIHETHFRHRGASVSGTLRPSATVAAWQPGPAAPVRGKASILSACVFVHPCPGERGRRRIHSSCLILSASTAPARSAPVRITPTTIYLPGKARLPGVLFSFSRLSYNGRDNWPDESRLGLYVR